MKRTLLHRYWFKTKEHRGFGITAYSIEDARSLVIDAAQRAGWSCEVAEIVEGVDVIGSKARSAEYGIAEFSRCVVSKSLFVLKQSIGGLRANERCFCSGLGLRLH